MEREDSDTRAPRDVGKSKKDCLICCFAAFAFLLILSGMPYIYTPPALTDEKLKAYEEFIGFVKSHRHIGDIRLHQSGTVSITRGGAWVEESQYLNAKELKRLEMIGKCLDAVGCNNAQTEGPMILFRPSYNWIAPHPAGALFSIDGSDPNLIGGPTVAANRPFENIGGKWYASRKLLPKGTGIYQVHLPKGIIDLTLKRPVGLR